MPSFRSDSDLPYLHYLRMTLLGLLGLVAMVMLMSAVLGASRYLRMPDGVVHARKAPKAEAVTPDDFLDSVNTAGAPKAAETRTGAGAATASAAADSDPANRRYAEEVQGMLRCAHAFAGRAGREEAEPTPAAVEDFRAQFEKVAAASPDRGEPWAGDVSQFVCATLEGQEALDLAKAGKLDQPLVSAVNFHIAQWDAARRKVREFQAQEKRRVENETVMEARRVDEARQSAQSAFVVAGVCFGMVLALAVCLLLAGIEASLRGIRESLEQLPSHDYGSAPLPLMHDEVEAPASDVHVHRPMAAPGAVTLDTLVMDDPLEVEYQIPEEAMSRG